MREEKQWSSKSCSSRAAAAAKHHDGVGVDAGGLAQIGQPDALPALGVALVRVREPLANMHLRAWSRRSLQSGVPTCQKSAQWRAHLGSDVMQ